MPPVYVKGGLWTNVEDEILKAAIAKYGLNQWSRVSSLLTRKNAKQCKLRWQEWLDPRIRKHDWSPDEDRQLLNLAKLRPNQWSSISLLLNRTANQCIERYQELLSKVDLNDDSATGVVDKTKRLLLTGNVESGQARGAVSGVGAGVGSSLGGLNLNPESKPARPDLTVMDEDEQEMISEARARLANTQGKKAKRKAREKILEESRRVAELLRRRELKQVGIDKGLKVKKTFKDQMDYNADIAFERRPQQGPFDTERELQLDIEAKKRFDKNTDVNGTFNQEIEAQKRKERKRRQQNNKFDEKPNAVKPLLAEVDELDDSNFAEEFAQRRKFVFSEEVGDNEIEDIDSIIGQTAEEERIRNNAKLGVLSRKRLAGESNEVSTTESTRDIERRDKKRRKELKKKIVEMLHTLPPAEDDFEIDVNLLLDGRDREDAPESEHIIVSSDKTQKHHIIIDQTERRRLEREKVQNLRAQIEEFTMPQSVRFGISVPVQVPMGLLQLKNGPMSPKQEIDMEMARIIQLGSASTSLGEEVDVSVLEKSVQIFTEVNEKIDELAEEVRMTIDYDSLLNKQPVKKYTQEQLISIIKTFTAKSMDIESRITTHYEQLRNENGFGHLMSSIQMKQKELSDLQSEIWAYEQFRDMEAKAIDSRKTRIQKDLDYVNLLIEKQRG